MYFIRRWLNNQAPVVAETLLQAASVTLTYGQIEGEKSMSWQKSLNEILKKHNKAAACGGKAVSFATQAARQETLWRGFKELQKLKYPLKDVHSFKERHICALSHAWELRGLSASTIQNRISVFRTFSEWIGKPGMIRGSENYVKNSTRMIRHIAAQFDKTWSAQKRSLAEKLAKLNAQDPYVAMQLELQRAFGLRMREAALLRAREADKGSYLTVSWGTKGGRDRVVPIQNSSQRDVLNRAQLMVVDRMGSMIPADYTFKQWKDHYYYICHQNGISRKHGITSHGLRHERLNEIYQEITGHASPIKSREIAAGKSQRDEQLDRIARQEIAEVAGHSRDSIASAYIGSKAK